MYTGGFLSSDFLLRLSFRWRPQHRYFLFVRGGVLTYLVTCYQDSELSRSLQYVSRLEVYISLCVWVFCLCVCIVEARGRSITTGVITDGWAFMWVLSIEPGSYARTSALNCWSSSVDPKLKKIMTRHSTLTTKTSHTCRHGTPAHVYTHTQKQTDTNITQKRLSCFNRGIMQAFWNLNNINFYFLLISCPYLYVHMDVCAYPCMSTETRVDDGVLSIFFLF